MAKRIGFEGNFVGVKEEKKGLCYSFVDFDGNMIKIRCSKEKPVIKRLASVSIDIDDVKGSFSEYGSESYKCDDFTISEHK